MPTEFQIIHTSDFIRWGAPGRIDFESTKSALAELALACYKRGINNALLDLRALELSSGSLLSPDELRALVGTFREMGFSNVHRLAVLYTADPHEHIRLFAFIGRLRGWNVAAFNDLGEAILWLADSKIDAPVTG